MRRLYIHFMGWVYLGLACIWWVWMRTPWKKAIMWQSIWEYHASDLYLLRMVELGPTWADEQHVNNKRERNYFKRKVIRKLRTEPRYFFRWLVLPYSMVV